MIVAGCAGRAVLRRRALMQAARVLLAEELEHALSDKVLDRLDRRKIIPDAEIRFIENIRRFFQNPMAA